MTDPPPAQPNDKRELLEAFDQVVDREREKVVERASVPGQHRTSPWVAILGAVSWGLLAYTWLAKPAWLFPPDPYAHITPAEQEAELRFAIYLTRERVLDYRARNGRLPATLAEMGAVENGVEYLVTGGSTFVVMGGVGAAELRLNDSEPADQLLAPTGIKPSLHR